MCSATVLNGIVGKALQLSVYSDTTEHAQNLAFALKSLPEIFKPNGKSTTTCPRCCKGILIKKTKMYVQTLTYFIVNIRKAEEKAHCK